MSFGYTRSAKKLKVGNPVAKSIVLLLADMASDSGFCFPSEKTIAETLELGESTVRKHLQALDGKFLTKTKLAGDKWKHNGYQLIFEPDFGEQTAEVSPLPERIITATTYHRYDVATKHNNKDLFFEPPEEEIKRERVSCRVEAREKGKTPALDKSFLQNEFFQMYGEFYPNVALSEKKIRLLTNRIRDGTIFRKALQYWDDNSYRPESIGKICDKYDELVLEKQNGETNGTGVQKYENRRFPESDAARRDREAGERIKAKRELDALLARRDKELLQGENLENFNSNFLALNTIEIQQ